MMPDFWGPPQFPPLWEEERTGYSRVYKNEQTVGLSITNLISFEMTFTYIAIIQDRIF